MELHLNPRARRRPRRTIVVLAALALAATALVRLVGASGVTASSSIFGTFAHVATGDISTDAAKNAVTSRYDMLALRGTLSQSLLTDLHARRAGITLLAYEKAAGLSNGDVTEILNANHPEWIAKDGSGNRIHPQNISDVTLGDLTNAGFQQWQAGKFATEVGMGADGAFVDTLGAYFPDDFYSSHPVVYGTTTPITNAAWRDGSVALLQRIKAAIGVKTVIANGFGLASGNAYFPVAADADLLINAADGVQIENFTRAGNAPADQYVSAARWDQDIAFLDLLGSRNKIALAYTKVKVTATTTQLTTLRDYALGSFLLGFKPGSSYVGFDDGTAIPAVTSDAPWARDLKSPLAARTRSATDEWSRSFQGGGLKLKAGGAPVVTPSSGGGGGGPSATFTGTGATRTYFPLTVGAGPVTATLTWSGGTKTEMIYSGNAIVAGPLSSATSPMVLNGNVAAGTYSFAVQGPSASDFTLVVQYTSPGGGGGATTTTATVVTTTTTTTRPPTTTTTTPVTTTTTSTTAPSGSRLTATFTGTGSTRTYFPLTMGAGSVTSTVTFGGGSYRTQFAQGPVMLGPVSTASPNVMTGTVPAGNYKFAVQGANAEPYTLTISYPAP
jgi:hypothetical protein